MRRALLMALALAGGCSADDRTASRAENGPPSPALSVVQAQMAAFNRHDVAELSAHIAHDVRLLTISGDSVLVDVRGRKAFEEQMREYFGSVDEVTSEIESALPVGSFVAIRERVTWKKNGRQATASSLGIYEVRGDSILRVWYFPPVD